MTFIKDALLGPLDPREQELLCATHANRGKRVLLYQVILKRRQDGPRVRSRSFRSRAAAVYYGCMPSRHSDTETPTRPRDTTVRWWAHVSAAET